MLKIKVVFLICLSIFFWVIYQADTGQNKVVFNVIDKVEYGDKYVHFLFYGFLSFLLNLILKFRQFNLSALNLRAVTLYKGSVIVFVFSLFEEFSQAFIPYRNFDLIDMAANFSGILLFAFITKLIAKNQAKIIPPTGKKEQE
ncbi:VanZ family protein [uncultured Psychrosphaera sp.]|uniref:VanZ family protein n=1 Tax=uncultured Psychrosphaera sp. TaxID=1403522 RepID=UPI002624E014|nr:VanZ family protein [uncultured Psychrosphaera sp.]